MKALALAAAVSLAFSFAAFAQDSKPSLKPNGVAKQPAEAAANIDVAAIQKKIDEFSEAIKRDPKNDKLYGARGQGYQKLGKLDLAIADLTRAIELNPSRQAYFQIRGNIFSLQKRFKSSCDDYRKALEIGPKTHYLVLKQGQTALLAGNTQEALRLARSADDLKKCDFDTLVLLGGVEQKLGSLQDSLRHLSKAVELSPEDPEVLLIRAETYTRLGKSDLAKVDVELAKKLGARP